ncbi:GNAT family N-acetyltransferase [Lysobacter enzymogenes]|uniref:GNAT family N-acetyltransferase n=1 Tax=Lysobacter enzymogenes TaxID=69 RepID=UPI001AF5A6FE|nr:N-acetyltransferase [Lysobacter enzymogenes]QQQ01105.1 GNAT family N-acetyltransferase [Lysobacter enzymogenes]
MSHPPDSAAPADARAAPPAVRVGVVSPMLAPAVRMLQVAPEQLPFVGDTAYNLEQTRLDPHSEAMAVLVGERVVGFYRLDFSVDAIAGRALGEPSVGLRAYAIDRREQGRGYGTAAMRACVEDLRLRHPQRRLLALTVNVRNLAAIAAYRKAGFADTGELYHGGSAGPQHLMLLRLAPPSPSPTATAP